MGCIVESALYKVWQHSLVLSFFKEKFHLKVILIIFDDSLLHNSQIL